MELNEEQKKQIAFQTAKLRHGNYKTNIDLGEGVVLQDFVVQENTLAPEKMTALYFARWLLANKKIYKNKEVLDLGCGSGIQGIVMGLNGAKKVVFSDIAKPSVENTLLNVKHFGIEEKSTVLQGDLFEKVNGKFDIIEFNHPFFPDVGDKSDFISLATRDDGKLIRRFFEKAKDYLKLSGKIIMPFFEKAGPTNNPLVQAPKYGYQIFESFSENIETELHAGKASVYVIGLK
ncbi:MAG: Rossmann-like fold-containing protein [archaeon]|jgi:methylase of polypeptide subunit release factors